jgi:O-antigen/teichoic acid export membrane protein
MDNGMVKFVSEFKAVNDLPRLRGTIFGGFFLVLTMSLLVGLVLFLSGGFLAERFFHKPQLLPVLRIIILSLPFSTLMVILLACLQGAKLIKYQVLVRQLLVPFARLLCVILVLLMGYRLLGVTWAYVLAMILGALWSGFFLIRSFRTIFHKGPIIFEKRRLIVFSLPLFFSQILKRVHGSLDIILIGYFLSTAMVGIYGVLQRFIPLILIPLTAFNSIFAPIISELYAADNQKDLQHQYKLVTKWILTASLPIFTLLTFFSREILALFGADFTTGAKAMIILCVGQLLNTATGSAGFMLMMTGKSYVNLINSVVLTLANVLLNLLLIPKYGIIGAALANAVSIIAVQIFRLAELWYFYRVHPYQIQTLKPIMSCLASLIVIMAVSQIELLKLTFISVPIFIITFLMCYVIFLKIFGLSQEDIIIVEAIKNKIVKQKMKVIKKDSNREFA